MGSPAAAASVRRGGCHSHAGLGSDWLRPAEPARRGPLSPLPLPFRRPPGFPLDFGAGGPESSDWPAEHGAGACAAAGREAGCAPVPPAAPSGRHGNTPAIGGARGSKAVARPHPGPPAGTVSA